MEIKDVTAKTQRTAVFATRAELTAAFAKHNIAYDASKRGAPPYGKLAKALSVERVTCTERAARNGNAAVSTRMFADVQYRLGKGPVQTIDSISVTADEMREVTGLPVRKGRYSGQNWLTALALIIHRRFHAKAKTAVTVISVAQPGTAEVLPTATVAAVEPAPVTEYVAPKTSRKRTKAVKPVETTAEVPEVVESDAAVSELADA